MIDCANGAAYKAAPEVLWELGAEVIPLGVSPNGLNINKGVGSTHPRAAAETVVAHGADLAEARRKAYAACEHIHFNGMQYRRDIGRGRGPA